MVIPLGGSPRCCGAGAESGDFAVVDPDLLANMIYMQTLGELHVARAGFIVRDAGQGVPRSCRWISTSCGGSSSHGAGRRSRLTRRSARG